MFAVRSGGNDFRASLARRRSSSRVPPLIENLARCRGSMQQARTNRRPSRCASGLFTLAVLSAAQGRATSRIRLAANGFASVIRKRSVSALWW